MKWKLIIALLSLLLFQEHFLKAQETPVLLPEFFYGYGIPKADLQKRFGDHLCVGTGLTYQPSKNNFNFGLRFTYFFGSTVNEDVLAPFRTKLGGLLIGSDNYLAEMQLKERGFILEVHGGGLIPVFSQNKARQSIKWQLGLGFMEHFIRFVDEAKALTQFNDEYVKGLDRLCNGWAFTPFVGYEYLSRKGWLSFYTGIEPVFGFTQNRRTINYDTNQSELGIARKDVMINFKFGIYLPLYLGHYYENIEY